VGLGGGIAPQQQHIHGLLEAFEVNERFRRNEMTRQRLLAVLDGRPDDRRAGIDEWRAGVGGDAGVRVNAANPPPMDNERNQRLYAAHDQQRQMVARMNVDPLGVYRQGGGLVDFVGGGPLPAMGHDAALGIVPPNFGGAQHQARK
jgi:hypothetical protein